MIAHAFLAACYSSLGRQTEAAAEADEVRRINPKFSLESYANYSLFHIFVFTPLFSDRCHLSSLLIRDAGFFESQYFFKHANGGLHNAHRQGSAGPLPQTHAQIKNGRKSQMC